MLYPSCIWLGLGYERSTHGAINNLSSLDQTCFHTGSQVDIVFCVRTEGLVCCRSVLARKVQRSVVASKVWCEKSLALELVV